MKNTQKKEEITPETYKKIIKKYPEITSNGYGIGSQPLTEKARKAQYDRSRKDLFDYREAFETCLNFARNRTSYGIKHEVYIPNGAFKSLSTSPTVRM